jgi:H+/Cl- antiporter ClcA
MMNYNGKDLIIAILFAYLVIDLLLAYAVKSRHPGVFETLANSLQDENIMVVLVIGVGAGVLAYYLARRSREMFTQTIEK